jgi:hypothetical protein
MQRSHDHCGVVHPSQKVENLVNLLVTVIIMPDEHDHGKLQLPGCTELFSLCVNAECMAFLLTE